MRTYETTFIVNPQTDDATIDSQVGAISKLILDNGGNILDENRMGTRRLAYPIQKLTQGYYTTFVYEGTSEVISILDRHFNLGEAYLRHLTIVFEGDLEKFNPSLEDSYDQEEKIAPVSNEPEVKSEAIEEAAESQEEEKIEEAELETEEPVAETSEEEKPKTDESTDSKEFNEDDQL